MHDSHIHISMSPLKENIQEDIYEFTSNNGKHILIQTTDITDYQDSLDMYTTLKKKYPKVVNLALGIHPSRIEDGVAKNNLEGIEIFKYAQKQYELFKEFFDKNKEYISAIGECGIDYYSMDQYFNFSEETKEEIKEAQRRIFTKLCKLSLKENLPMSIHARDIKDSDKCVKDTLKILAKEGNGLIRGSFHSYTGSIKMLNQILDLGLYVGFNAIITYPSGENVREILKNTPLERILFETDGPFLPTQSVRKKKNATKRYGRPVLVKEIMEKASEIKNTPYEKLESVTDENYLTLFLK